MNDTSLPVSCSLLLLFALLPPAASASGNGTGDEHLFKAPPVTPLGPTRIDVYPNGYQVVGGSFVTETGYPLLRAIEAAEPLYAAQPTTVVLEVHGNVPAPLGQFIGGGDPGQKPYRASWKNHAIDVAVRGATGFLVDTIPGFVLRKNLGDGTPTPGVARFRVEGLSIRPGPYANSVVSTPNGLPPTGPGGVYPLVELYGCRIQKGQNQPHWGVRLHGRARFDFRNNVFESMKEHAAYVDSPQGDSYFVGNVTQGATRTMLQVVNRATDNPGPSGHGVLLIQSNIATNIDGSGGSDFTIAGHLGTVILRGNLSYQGPWQTGSQGSIVVYTDESVAHGTHLNAAGYSTGKVIVQGHLVYAPDADRDHVMISGAQEVEFRDGFILIGAKTAITFDAVYGGSVANGTERIYSHAPASVYPGFLSLFKVRRGTAIQTPYQIDALWCP